jgi:hypothetical protein
MKKKRIILFAVEHVTLKDTWDLGARGLSDCVEGSWRERLKLRKEISKIGFSWMKETLDFSF